TTGSDELTVTLSGVSRPAHLSTSGKLSATATLTLTVAEREGCPLSSTTTVSLFLISPFCKPTSNSALSVAFCSLYESQAFCPESTSTATTLVTRYPTSAERGTISATRELLVWTGYRT
uniref:Uncharacterized protein n=1 Tax=Oncorhynchus tshawytscha TaxID=74940 RepID=A0AAZ3RMX1_ONCTS